ncbi:hypothetical protein [Bacteroides sp. 14(A)]|uniref:hypothetical protein n=1 Tax=Bacteroides sp. 14(A) TaxID=1163670 RepID=UPI0018CC16AD|nr:hypothetical protein [Bacteroides sp. 14(A)]
MREFGWRSWRFGCKNQTVRLVKVTSVLSSTASYAATGASVGGPWGAVIGGAIGMASGLIGILGADYSAYNKMKEEYGALIDVWDTLISKKQKI